MHINEARPENRYRGSAINQGRAPSQQRRDQHRPQAGPAPGHSHVERLGNDPWYYAPLSGACYHLQRNCGGLRNARSIKGALSMGDKRRALYLFNLRPCRICVTEPIQRERAAAANNNNTAEDTRAELD